MSAPEQIRREWRTFQAWYTAMRNEEENNQELNNDLAKRPERRNNMHQWLGNTLPTIHEERETAKKLIVEGRVASRAKEEWQRRLNKVGLRMEQWTDITVSENAAVAAALWGGTTVEETRDFATSESSDETETETDPSPGSIIPSTSARGSQLWTPPEIARTSELPLSNIPGSSDSTTKGGDKKKPAPRGPSIPTQRLNPRGDTNKSILPLRSMREPADEQKTPSPALEALQTDNTTSEAGLKVPVLHMSPRLEDDRDSRKSWSDDDRTLLATSTDDEFYETDEEANRATPHYQKIPLYAQWAPGQQNTSKPDITKPTTNNTSLRTDTTTVQPPIQIKTSNQPDTPKAPVKTYSASYTPTQSYAAMTLTTQPSNIAPNVQNPRADRPDLRKQIEEILMPLVNEAKETLQRKIAEAQSDPISCDKFTKEHKETLKNICQTAEKLYREQIEQEQVNMGEHSSLDSITKQQVTSDHQKRELEGPRPKARGSSDRSPHTANTTKPPSPLTPPRTPPQPGTRYIGPVLTEEEMKEEAAAFDEFTLAIRKQKISEFHKEAALMEYDLVEQFHTRKPDKKATWEILKRHDQNMEELRKIKEQERKDMCVAERKKRMARIEARTREKEADGYQETTMQTNPRQRSDSFQQRRKDDEMTTQTRWRLARADPSDTSKNSQGQTIAEHATATNTQNHNVTSHVSPTKDKSQGVRARPIHPPTEKAEGSSGLLFVNSVDHKSKGPGRSEASLKTGRIDRITPLSPTVHLPKLESDTEDDDGDDDDEPLMPNLDTKTHKHVRFRSGVQVVDSDTDSSDTDRPVSNSLGLGTGSGPDISRRPWIVPRELDNGEGSSKGPIVTGKVPMVGLKQARREPKIDIWHPPTEEGKGKGKEREVVLDAPSV